MSKRIIVIGGGAAGMAAAATAAKNGGSVTLIEKNRILGKKLLITGKGRCNVTNYCDNDCVIKNITSGNPKFMYSALNLFGSYDTYAFFENLGVPLKVERGSRVFPVSDRAADIRNALEKYMRGSGVFVLNERVLSVSNDLSVTTDRGVYNADAVVVATGGMSYPSTGSTGDGYAFAKSLNHKIVKTRPALVPLFSRREDCAPLAGLSLRNVGVRFYDKTGVRHSDFGEMLFTHEGVSGPVILTASSLIDFDSGDFTLAIDLKPALTEKELDSRILRDFEKYVNKDFQNALSDLLPQKIIPAIIERSGIPPRVKVNSVTKEQRASLVRTIKAFELEIKGAAGFDEAIITAGGVDTSEIDPKTMGSKLVKGLYFAGEVIDVSALTGGYNLQIAFSTGCLAGLSCMGGKNEL